MGCGIQRVLQINEPIVYQEVTLFDENSQDITNSCMFSWSMDMLCWSNWTNYDTYKTLGPQIEGDYYLRILISTGFSKIALGDNFTNCYTINLYSKNMFLDSFCDDVNLFNPYAGLDCALLLQRQLSDSVICMLGIPIYYFRVVPDPNSADYTFKEYTLHNVESVKYIKAMCEDGQLPSSKPQMTEFDFDWENDWEIELSKTQFATAFGDTAFPKQRDMIYVPMMKRMYEVNSAYDEKNEGLMWHSTTWKLALVKWSEKNNVDQGEFEEIIDSLIINKYEETFKKEPVEQERESGVTQAVPFNFNPTNLTTIYMQDSVRQSISKEEINNIATRQINHKNMVICRNVYDFKSLDSIVLYQNKYCGDNGSISFVVDIPSQYYKKLNRFLRVLSDDRKENEPTIISFKKPLLVVGNIAIFIEYEKDNHLYLTFADNKVDLLVKDDKGKVRDDEQVYIVNCRWNRDLFVCDMTVYRQNHRDLPIYMLKPEMYEFDFNNAYATSTSAYNNEYSQPEKVEVYSYPGVVPISNIKLYENYLSEEDIIKESLKYTTTNESCVLNDLARPLEINHGYSVR